jgi:DNA replication and repair protein RecF
LEVPFQAKKNLIFGPNGAGKTSVLEAIFLLGFGKSFLSVRKEDLIQDRADGFSVLAKVQNRWNENRIGASLSGKSFRLQLNDQPTNMSEICNYLHPILFSSHTFQNSLDFRPRLRGLMDRFIFGVHSLYLHYILRYNKALKQKNHLLKNRVRAIDISEIASWNKILAEMGSKLIEERMKFVTQLNEAIANRFGNDLRIEYRPSLPSPGPISQDTLFLDLQAAMPHELKSKRSLIGPQRDQFDIWLKKRKLNTFSSGEKKKFFMMMYFSYIGFYKKERQEYPVFLIDDFDSALDQENLDFLVDHYPDVQIVATSVKRNEKFDHFVELRRRSNP